MSGFYKLLIGKFKKFLKHLKGKFIKIFRQNGSGASRFKKGPYPPPRIPNNPLH
jgi:hypothetical protein